MKQVRKFLFSALFGAMIVSFAVAQDAIDVNNPGSGDGWNTVEGVLTFSSNGSYTLTGWTMVNNVVVSPGVTATITLQECNINTSAPFTVGSNTTTGVGANVTLRLVGGNVLSSTSDLHAALNVEGPAHLTIEGEGSLLAETPPEATNSVQGSAGIGSNSAGAGNPTVTKKAGTITVNGGDVTAVGGYWAAGIGGGANSHGGTLTVNGGRVIATGGRAAAGVGGGCHGNGGTIIVNNGYLTASGGRQGAGIGGGYTEGLSLTDGGEITVVDGVVMGFAGVTPYTAINDPYSEGAGIGAGGGGTSGKITISGGVVRASSVRTTVNTADKQGGAGIGGPAILSNKLTGDNGQIRITGGLVMTTNLGVSGGYPSSFIHTATYIGGGDSTVVVAGQVSDYATRAGGATIIEGVLFTEDLFRAMAKADKLRWFEVYDTVHIHDTIRLEIHDTVIGRERDTIHIVIRDTIGLPYYDTIEVEIHDTITREVFVPVPGDTVVLHDTVPQIVYDTVNNPIHDTIRVLVHDTIVNLVHDTITQKVPYEVYIVIDAQTGAETTVQGDIEVIINEGDRVWIRGLNSQENFVIYDATGTLIYSGRTLPVKIPSSGVFFVGQSGNWHKFLK